MSVPKRWSVELTHFGRKSGRPFKLSVWYVELDGSVWVGSRDRERNWVRNLRSTGRAEIDFGKGPAPYQCTEGSAEDQGRFDRAVLGKHPIAGRLIVALARGKTPCCFRLTPAA